MNGESDTIRSLACWGRKDRAGLPDCLFVPEGGHAAQTVWKTTLSSFDGEASLMMRKYDSMAAWEGARAQETWLDGVSLEETTRMLSVSEQELGELLLKGELSVSYIHQNGEVVKAVVPLRDAQRYVQRNRAPSSDQRRCLRL